jgi:ABC-type dipeptide/oligopeptide/nickel transport system permease component
MILFILKRLFVIVLTLLCLSFIVFSLVTIEPNLKKLALNQANMRMEEEAVQSWLEKNGYKRPLLVQYTEWLGDAVTGDFGYSTHFRKPVNEVVWPKLGHTGILMFWVLLITIPISLVIGVISGMQEGSKTDRSLSVFFYNNYFSTTICKWYFINNNSVIMAWIIKRGSKSWKYNIREFYITCFNYCFIRYWIHCENDKGFNG